MADGLMLLARRNEELLEERARLSEELDTLRGALSVAAKQLEELKSAEALSRLQKRSNARHAHAATAATGTVTSSGTRSTDARKGHDRVSGALRAVLMGFRTQCDLIAFEF